jgi:hypothetical protein
MKVVISGGFILAFGLLYRSRVPIMERMEGHGSVAASGIVPIDVEIGGAALLALSR